jgi:hypothetical protein
MKLLFSQKTKSLIYSKWKMVEKNGGRLQIFSYSQRHFSKKKL